jgi:GNAT superfamily N-acetyltransferase
MTSSIAEVACLGLLEVQHYLTPTMRQLPYRVLSENRQPSGYFAAELVGTDQATVATFQVLVFQTTASMFIDRVDVMPDHRRRGVSSAIFEAILRWARANQIGRIELAATGDGAYFWPKVGFEISEEELDNLLTNARLVFNLNIDRPDLSTGETGPYRVHNALTAQGWDSPRAWSRIHDLCDGMDMLYKVG